MNGFSKVTDSKFQLRIFSSLCSILLISILVFPRQLWGQVQEDDSDIVKLTEQQEQIEQKLKQRIKEFAGEEKAIRAEGSINLNTLDDEIIQFDFDQ